MYNYQAEYKALVIGLEILKDMGAKYVTVSGDSQLVLRQMSGEYKCSSLFVRLSAHNYSSNLILWAIS
ncbi:hypothetical protein F511_30128 [Dorcoceras hygrometricum]|uniref:RNase H type-1 domain-containing protein n=1 Tax=Dorcoceras hygrometricum TaxID=472368 RepID=A0A2Z7AAA4_9LAMI|nr:hypothetical protein F511_30128 [Dorcoceras hygrometricum]